MNEEQMQAARQLVEFALDHINDVYGKRDEHSHLTEFRAELLQAVDTLTDYLDEVSL